MECLEISEKLKSDPDDVSAWKQLCEMYFLDSNMVEVLLYTDPNVI